MYCTLYSQVFRPYLIINICTEIVRINHNICTEMVRIGKNGVRKDTDLKKKSSSHPAVVSFGKLFLFKQGRDH